MRITPTLLTLLLLSTPVFVAADTYTLNDDLHITAIAPGIYTHTSYHEFPEFGRVASNGLIIMREGEALLVDTPCTKEQTRELVEYLAATHQARVTQVIVTHYHVDCLGGLAYLHEQGVKSTASERTLTKCIEEGLPLPQTTFDERTRILFRGLSVEAYYFGPGHTRDNIVFYEPESGVLFGGCLIRAAEARNLGNTADADIGAWAGTVEKLQAKLPGIKHVVPGHGQPGGPELLDHTIELARGQARSKPEAQRIPFIPNTSTGRWRPSKPISAPVAAFMKRNDVRVAFDTPLISGGARLISFNKPVSYSGGTALRGELSQIVNARNGRFGGDASRGVVALDSGPAWVTIDLEGEYLIEAINFWHEYYEPDIYHDVVVQAARDAEFTQAVITLFNNDRDKSLGLGKGKDLPYLETPLGKVVEGKSKRVRYVRLWSDGSVLSTVNKYIEVEVYAAPPDGLVWLDVDIPLPATSCMLRPPKDIPNMEPWTIYVPYPPLLAVPTATRLVSRGKPVSHSGDAILGSPEQVTDGDKGPEACLELAFGLQWVQIDLEAEYEFQGIVFWQKYNCAQVYFDVIVQVASDPDFESGVVTLYNNDYDNSAGFGIGTDNHFPSTHAGRRIDGLGIEARYVRIYSSGSHMMKDISQYTEIEVYGVPLAAAQSN